MCWHSAAIVKNKAFACEASREGVCCSTVQLYSAWGRRCVDVCKPVSLDAVQR